MLSKNISRRDDNDGEGNENVKNNNRLLFFSKTTIARVSLTLFCTFLCRHCPTTTRKCLYSFTFFGGRVNMNKLRRFFFFLYLDKALRNSAPAHSTFDKVLIMSWNNRKEGWKNANSLFKWRFCCRCRHRILRSVESRKQRPRKLWPLKRHYLLDKWSI